MSKPSTKGFWELLRNSLADEELPFKPVQAYLSLLGPVQLPKKRHVFLRSNPYPYITWKKTVPVQTQSNTR